MSTGTQLLVGMAEIKVAKGPATFTCLGLGSCIGLVAFDEQADVWGMVHIMLPEAFKDKPVDKIGKFANTGIPAMIAEMEKLGASPSRMVMALTGGAQVFKFGSAASSRLDVGARNAEATLEILRGMRAKISAQDTGGSSGRTMIVKSDTGVVTVRTVHGGETELCCLRRSRRSVAA